MLPSNHFEFFEALLLGVIVVWLLFLYRKTQIRAVGFIAGYLSVPIFPLFLQAYISNGDPVVESGKAVVVIGHALFTGLLMWATWPEMSAKPKDSVPKPASASGEEPETSFSGSLRTLGAKEEPDNNVEKVRKLLSEVKTDGQ
jgi:hypothetical protein